MALQDFREAVAKAKFFLAKKVCSSSKRTAYALETGTDSLSSGTPQCFWVQRSRATGLARVEGRGGIREGAAGAVLGQPAHPSDNADLENGDDDDDGADDDDEEDDDDDDDGGNDENAEEEEEEEEGSRATIAIPMTMATMRKEKDDAAAADDGGDRFYQGSGDINE
eukprot:s439_g5.t1